MTPNFTQDNALNELRQELGNLKIASAAAAEAENAARLLQQQQYQHRLSMGAQMQAPALPSAASRGLAVNGAGSGVTREGGGLVRTLSVSSGDSFGEACGLGAIAEAVEEEVDEEEQQEEGEVGCLSSQSDSESEEEEEEEEESGSEDSEGIRSSSVSRGVNDDGGVGGGGSGDDAERGAAVVAAAAADPAAATPCRRVTLSLDTNTDTDSDDDDEEEVGEESFATLKFAAADKAHAAAGSRRPSRTSGGARLSISSYSLSPGPRGVRGAGRARASVAPGSKSLSPVPRSGGARASWSPGGSGGLQMSPVSNYLSPMVRLAPVDHGMGKEGNTVVLELGAWRVRVGIVGEGGGGEEGEGERASYFDDFPCCMASPLREGADLDELVNGASSLAAPMYSKFRE